VISRRWLSTGAVLALLACNARSDKLWPAGMEQQQAVQPLEEARQAPVGSVPLGGVETLDDREDDTDLKSPFPLDDAAAARGAKSYAIHCAICHGATARGDGKVSDKFPQAPNLRHSSICKRTDGFLYGTLTAGGRAMPTMREGMTSHERWDLVAYVRSIQKEGCTSSQPATPPPTGAQGGTP
jgi:mono/diheme cytochrome c family protein